jgi:cytochrome c553
LGTQIAATCASCHGEAGVEAAIPAIIGMGESQIIDKMRAYRASESPSHVMHAIALSLNEDELLAVARALAVGGSATE